MNVASIIKIPIVALDYLTKGDPKGLTPEQIKAAEEWNKDWEITSVEEYMENENLSYNLTNSLIDEMDFDDFNDDDDFG